MRIMYSLSEEYKELITNYCKRSKQMLYSRTSHPPHMGQDIGFYFKNSDFKKVLDNMKAYSNLQKLKRAVLMYIATRTSQRKLHN